MNNKESEYQVGECVAINNAVKGAQGIIINDVCGIILEKELVEMDEDVYEWLYLISIPSGIDDFWPYEIKPVKCINQDYNTLNTHKGVN